MAFVVLYDACVLYPAPVRDLLLRVSLAGLVQAKWSQRILDECFRNILKNRPDLNAAQLTRTRELMDRAVPDASVHGFETLEESLTLPDPKDRHVLAAAIRAGAQTIVTWNRKDFPEGRLVSWNIEIRDPDDFVLGLIDLAPGIVLQILQKQASALRNPPVPFEQLLSGLRENGLGQSVARIHELLTNPNFEF